VTDNEERVHRRPRKNGVRRVMVGANVRLELHEALSREAVERGCTLSVLAADVLAQHAGVEA
jgi:hypothetical protein